MIQISKADLNVSYLLRGQLVQPNQSYRLSQFLICPSAEEGGINAKGERVLCNTMTREVFLLSPEEGEALDGLRRSEAPLGRELSAFQKELVRHYCLVPKELDEARSYLELIDTLRLMLPKIDRDNYYDILASTDCNARCPYCYEAGKRGHPMDVETARQVADYIIRTKEDGPVSIRWFGGEPLMGADAITVVSQALEAAAVPFSAFLITNASLFTPELIRHAADHWHLDAVQISLDGRREAYDRVKAYVTDFQGSPYERVLENIHLLAQAGIRVMIRLNVGTENAEELLRLTDELTSEFAGEKQISVYTDPLFQEITSDKIEQVLDFCSQMDRRLEQTGLSSHVTRPDLIVRPRTFKCRPSHYGSINADGQIILCTKYFDRPWKGHSVSDPERFAPPEPGLRPACRACPYLPSCMGHTGCHRNPEGCRTLRDIVTKKVLRRMLEAR